MGAPGGCGQPGVPGGGGERRHRHPHQQPALQGKGGAPPQRRARSTAGRRLGKRLTTHAGSTCRCLWSLLYCNMTSSIAHHTKFTPDSGAQAGRVTFCPLNRIAPEAVRYPGDLGTDAQPLIARLEFDARFQKAVQQARRRRCCRPSEFCTQIRFACRPDSHADLMPGVLISQPHRAPVSPVRPCPLHIRRLGALSA